MQLISERAFWQLLPTERSTISFSVDGPNGCTSEKKKKKKKAEVPTLSKRQKEF